MYFKRNIESFENKNLWLSRRLNLKCLKSKYFNCQVIPEWKISIKRYKCELCKILRQYSGMAIYIKNQRYDTYA